MATISFKEFSGNKPVKVVGNETSAEYKKSVTSQKVPNNEPGLIESTIKDIPSDIKETFSGAKKSVTDAMQKSRDIYANVEAGKTSPLAGTLQTIGAGLGAGADVIGQGILGVGKAILPQSAEDKISDTFKKGVDYVVSQDSVKELINKYQSLPEETRRNIDASLGVVGGLTTIFGVGPTTRAIKTGTSEVANVVGKATKAGIDTAVDIADTAKSGIKKGVKTVVGDAEEKATNQIWDVIQPKLSAKEQIAARKSGLIDETTFGRTKLMPDNAHNLELIDSAKSVIDPKSTPTKQIADASTRVSQLNDANKAFLRQNDGIFTKNQIRKYLESTKLSNEARNAVIFGNDEAMEKAYTSMVDGFMKVLDKYPKEYSSVLDARQEFDRIADSVIPKAFDADARDTIKKIALRDIRMGANDFLADNVKGGQALKDSLRNETLLLEVIDNIAAKAPKIGDTSIGRFNKRNPITGKAIEKVANMVGLGGTLGVVK